MPKPISTFCSASRSHLAVIKAPHVWISEDVLSETFTNFVRNQKRYGSNVPGPLEARRRASKRRATHLAHQSAATYNPESFGLFDTRSQDGWWKKEDNPIAPPTTSWPWPFTIPLVARGPPPPPRPVTIDEALGVPSSTHEELKTSSLKKEIHVQLSRVRTHTEAMDVLSHLGIDLRRNPNFTEVVLKHMLHRPWKHGEIAEFLLDPWTNPPGTTNHVYMLENAEKHADVVEWLLQENVFTKAARLGLLDIHEIQRMFLLIPRLCLPEFLKSATRAQFCSQLMTAMDESKVLTICDLEKPFIAEWLEAIVSQSFCPAVPNLLWRMYRLLGLSDGEALEKVAHTSISMIEQTTICQLNSLVDFLRSQPYESVGPVLFSLTQRFLNEAGSQQLEKLPTSSLERSVDRVFREDLLRLVGGAGDSINPAAEEKLPVRFVFKGTLQDSNGTTNDKSWNLSAVRMLQQRMEKASKLELWYAILGNLGSTAEFQFEMDVNPLKNFVQPPLEGLEAVQRLMTAAWVAMALSVQNDSFIKISGVSRALAAELRRAFLTATASSEDVLVKLLDNLQLLPLPAKNKLLRRIHELSDKLITVRQNYWDMVQLLHHLNDARILEIGKPVTYRSMKLHFPVKLREMCEGFNEDMSMFQKSCIDMIRHVKGSVGIVLRILHHNQRLQRSLQLAGLMTDSSHRVLYRPLRARIEVIGGRSPLELLDMIETFAHEIARSEQVSSRSAFRQVYWLTRYLVRQRVPIRTAMWKALWHARVTRQDEQGGKPCYYTVSWLYEKIAKTDGYAEADHLLRISSMTDLMKLPDEIDTIEEPRIHNPHDRDDALRAMAANPEEAVEILPFNVSSLTTSMGSPSEAETTNKVPRQSQELPTQLTEEVQNVPTVKTSKRPSLKASYRLLLQNRTGQAQRTVPMDNTDRKVVTRSSRGSVPKLSGARKVLG